MSEFTPIPGETPIDVSRLKIKSVTNRRELNIAEAKNVSVAVLKHLGGRPNRRTAPFTMDWCLAVHREMFCDVWEWAGEIRDKPLSLGIPAHRIRTSLYDLLKDLESWDSFGFDPLEQSVWLQHRAVQIHPFFNGNGRWSRLLANILLKREGHAVIEWPETTLGEVSTIRDEYIAAIQAADAGSYDPLIELCRKFSTG